MAVSTHTVTTARALIDAKLIEPVYQPIVDLDDGHVVAYEALARGPQGSPLEQPGAMFGAAAAEGLTYELDWACHEAALLGAMEAGLHRDYALFVNAEPSSFERPMPSDVQATVAMAAADLQLVTEITEREITRAPAALLARVASSRASGLKLAIDDVGVDPRSLALLPFVRPEVVKLDMAITQTVELTKTARTATAVRAHAERSGALIVAEGIETRDQHDTALALGAHLGQGWHFGRPGPLPRTITERPVRPLRLPTVDAARSADTPFGLLSAGLRTRVGRKDLLLRMSRALEDQAQGEGDAAVIVSTFQTAEFFTPASRSRYRELARSAALVGAIGVGLDEAPEPGVRGASLWRSEPLCGEWDVCVVGPYFAGAFAARDLGDTGPDRERRFEFVVTHERELVIAATAALIARITA